MTDAMRVGLIGLGSIADRLLGLLAAGAAGPVEVVGALVRDAARARPIADRYGVFLATDLAALLDRRPSLVVECAGHGAVRAYAEPVLASGRDLVLLSVGALADEALRERIAHAAAAAGRRVIVPAGAIAGLDAIGAAALGELSAVTHTVRKPPRAFTPSQLVGVDASHATVLYDGPASAGVTLFPENVNVAAAVSLAGLGLDRTTLRVICDPAIDRNMHEVDAIGSFGRLRITIENAPGPNPKTGRIVALSVADALRRYRASFLVGA